MHNFFDRRGKDRKKEAAVSKDHDQFTTEDNQVHHHHHRLRCQQANLNKMGFNQ